MKFEIPIAPMKEQQVIVQAISSMLDAEQSAANTAKQVISQIDMMKKAILARAFRGGLGTNDPSEPPAEIDT